MVSRGDSVSLSYDSNKGLFLGLRVSFQPEALVKSGLKNLSVPLPFMASQLVQFFKNRNLRWIMNLT